MRDKNHYKISAVVPAFNEEKKVGSLLQVLRSCPIINEIICVNDGSTDATYEEIKKIPGIKLFNLRKNHGKSYAVTHGIKKASGDIIVLIDADLDNLKDKHIRRLISPLLSGKYDAVIGYYSYHSIDGLFKPLSGERAYFKNDLLKYLNNIQNEGYGLELRLNYLFKDKKVKVFEMKGVRHTLKHEKQPYNIIARLVLRESRDIFSQIIKQKNPVEYLARSYFYPFYLKEPKVIKRQLKKLIKVIKRLQKEAIEI